MCYHRPHAPSAGSQRMHGTDGPFRKAKISPPSAQHLPFFQSRDASRPPGNGPKGHSAVEATAVWWYRAAALLIAHEIDLIVASYHCRMVRRRKSSCARSSNQCVGPCLASCPVACRSPLRRHLKAASGRRAAITCLETWPPLPPPPLPRPLLQQFVAVTSTADFRHDLVKAGRAWRRVRSLHGCVHAASDGWRP